MPLDLRQPRNDIFAKLENLKVKMEDRQQGDDHQDNETAMEQVFQEVSPEKADDHKHDNGGQKNQHPPYYLWYRRKINRHSGLLNGNIPYPC
jgi:hypothetical protein